jgi:hypothetical protein
VYPLVTEAFQSLMDQSACMNDNIVENTERFVIIMYNRTCTATNVNQARRELFTKGSRSIDHLPSTKSALIQHIKRAILQASFIWWQALKPCPVIPSPTTWGWQASHTGWEPFWTDLPEASIACKELIHCGCKKGCRGQCKCHTLNLPCTELCYCKGGCTSST